MGTLYLLSAFLIGKMSEGWRSRFKGQKVGTECFRVNGPLSRCPIQSLLQKKSFMKSSWVGETDSPEWSQPKRNFHQVSAEVLMLTFFEKLNRDSVTFCVVLHWRIDLIIRHIPLFERASHHLFRKTPQFRWINALAENTGQVFQKLAKTPKK
jgi:hypothetical protein